MAAVKLCAQFSEKVHGCADFIANYVREVTVCVLENFNKAGDKLVERLQKHPFVSHFTSTAAMSAGTIDGQKLFYLCLELYNIVFPVLEARKV